MAEQQEGRTSEGYLKVNKYQTILTEDLRQSLPKEVWTNLIDFIDSVKFINWLISPEETRGYAVDLPKEEDGRIKVNITKPHMLVDMDYFRERAIYFQQHGRYTHLRPNANPKSEFATFWKEELYRWEHGLIRDSDGEWIPGWYYFYLNYVQIFVNKRDVKDKSKKTGGERVRDFPDVFLGDYLFFHYLDQAKKVGSHSKMLKSRGIGASYKLASISPCNMYIYKGLPNFHLASDKTFLDGEKGVFGKVIDVLDFIGDNTPLPRMRLINSPRSREIQLGYQDEYGIKQGLKSSVFGISLKDNPDKARGVRGKLIHYEEDGLFPNIEKAWNVNRKAVEDGNITFGLMMAAGCVCGGTKVWTNDGRQINIENIKQSDGILGFKDGKVNLEPITYIQDPLEKECIRIKTKNRYLECSYDHPILVRKCVHKRAESYKISNKRLTEYSTEWKRAVDLTKKDTILIVDKINIFGSDKLFDPRLVGMLIGDGSYGFNKTPVFSNCDYELNNYVMSKYNVTIEKTYQTKLNKTYNEIRIKDICSKLRDIGIYGQTKTNKRLPINYQSLDSYNLSELIGGLFDTDGCVTGGRISITQSSKDLLLQISEILLKFGVHSTIQTKYPRISKLRKDKNIYYVLEIASIDSILNFKNNIKFLCKYKQDALDLISERKNILRIHNDLDGLREERVNSIEKIGIKRIYNLTANDSNTYIANGIVTHNTGGTEGADFEGSEKMFRNPLAYNIYGIPNVFDKNSNEENLVGFFWGAYLNRAECYDKLTGEPDVVMALIEILKDRYYVKYNSTDPTVLTQRMAEEPIVPAEAVMRVSGTIFPIADLKDCRDNIKMQGSRFFDAHYVGDLILKDNGVEWTPNGDIYPIRTYPTGTNKPEGAVEIFEMPKIDNDGKMDPMRYIGGIDPVDDDESQTNSLTSIFIFDLYADKIVAEYTGRPKFANDFYEIARRLLLLFNAKANYENNKKGLFTYFDQKRCLHLLCDTPQILRDMEYVKSTGYGNKSKGSNASAAINMWGRRLQRDYLLGKANQQDYNENGDQVGEKKNMHTIRSIAYLEELIQWNESGNFDRISAMGMLMIYREERLKYINNTYDDDEKDPEFDKYIYENFKNAFR